MKNKFHISHIITLIIIFQNIHVNFTYIQLNETQNKSQGVTDRLKVSHRPETSEC